MIAKLRILLLFLPNQKLRHEHVPGADSVIGQFDVCPSEAVFSPHFYFQQPEFFRCNSEVDLRHTAANVLYQAMQAPSSYSVWRSFKLFAEVLDLGFQRHGARHQALSTTFCVHRNWIRLECTTLTAVGFCFVHQNVMFEAHLKILSEKCRYDY